MHWNLKSKKAFTQALNIEFLIATGSYANFQFDEKKEEIYMLFSDNKTEKCQKYLEQVTAQYKKVIVSENSFDTNSFPFCISPGKFRPPNKKGIKFKVPLNKKVINNLYYMFIIQFLSFEMNAGDLPSGILLTEDDKKKSKYIAGWAFSQERGNPDLKKERITTKLLREYHFDKETKDALVGDDDILCHCIYIRESRANEAVQKAINDFPTRLLKQYSKSLLMLFSIFCQYTAVFTKSMDSIKKENVEVDRNAVILNCCKEEDANKIASKTVRDAIYDLYKKKSKNNVTFNDDFIKQDGGKVSFNFDFYNVNVILATVPCNIDHVSKAYDFAYGPVVGAVGPTSAGCSSSVSRVDAVPSSSKGSTKGDRSDSPSTSFAPEAPTASSTHSDITVINKSKNTGNLDNSESKHNVVRSNFTRSKSVPVNKPHNVFDETKVKKSFSDMSQIVK